MCGVIALFPKPGQRFEARDATRPMDAMRRRGPDARGVVAEERAVLGHLRLAIQDLDARSNQPMVSADGRLVISYNGEIYNVAELRAEILARGTRLRTTSDTEVILELFAADGPKMLERLRGMFAFVIWDRSTKRGFVARDPYGIKPLYLARTPRGVAVASQVKALMSIADVSTEPNAKGQAMFWMLGSVAEPNTWFRDVAAIPAGHFAWIEDGQVALPVRWWDIAQAWRESAGSRDQVSAVQEVVGRALHESIARHLVSDVPVGLLLSGGIDSGAIAGLMVDCGVKDIHAITVTFPEFAGKRADEVPGATSTAAAAGLRHTVRPVTRDEFRADLPRILAAVDQPSVDGINTWYATKAVAEQGLKVALSGVGGDELFLGYSSFRRLPPLQAAWAAFSRIPGAMATASLAGRWQSLRSGNSRWAFAPHWLRTIPGAWWTRRGLFSPADLPELMGPELAREALLDFSPEALVAEMSGPLARDSKLALAQIESTTYLRNQLLRDSDWASMDHSVELRTPLVDAWLLRELAPILHSLERFPGKRLLAEAPRGKLPAHVVARTKTGFGTPIHQWLSTMGPSKFGEGGTRGWGRYLASHLYAA